MSKVTIEILDTIATVKNGEWECSDPVVLNYLRTFSPETTITRPRHGHDPDYALAKRVGKVLNTVIVNVDEPIRIDDPNIVI